MTPATYWIVQRFATDTRGRHIPRYVLVRYGTDEFLMTVDNRRTRSWGYRSTAQTVADALNAKEAAA